MMTDRFNGSGLEIVLAAWSSPVDRRPMSTAINR